MQDKQQNKFHMHPKASHSLRGLLIAMLFFGSFSYNTSSLSAQDYGWWNTLVDWDGRSHWSEYLTYTPKFFGPNAIPIPDIKNGKIINDTEFEVGLATHFSQGDDAQNLTTRLFIPVTKDRIGLQLYVVPYERYKMTSETRDIRRARDFDGEGFALGDIHIGTWIQLTRPNSPTDVLLTLNIKTASGSNREATRFTDGSGYNFDLSVGRTIKKGEQQSIRPHAQIGFYVWETNEDRNPQNDAFSYGAGADWSFKQSIVTAQIAGFIGYKGNGDKPIAAKINFAHDFSSALSMRVATQYGFKDNLYRSFFLSLIRKW